MLNILNQEQVLNNLLKFAKQCPVQCKIFYSSLLGGVVTDRALMVIPVFDQIHQGRAIFDTCAIRDGKAIQLENHLERFLKSAETARIQLPQEINTYQKLKELIVSVVAYSQERNTQARFWLTVGIDNSPAIYIAIDQVNQLQADEGKEEVTITKKTTFIQKSMAQCYSIIVQDQAQKQGGTFGLVVDNDNILYPSFGNVFFILNDTFVTPEPVQDYGIYRYIECAKELQLNVQVRSVKLEEAYEASEACLVNDLCIYQITSINSKSINYSDYCYKFRQMLLDKEMLFTNTRMAQFQI